jgi:hypothetical protein
MCISQYKTQKSLKEYFREVINQIGVCDSVKTKHLEKYLDFCEVFKRHPKYPDKFFNLVDVKIDYNPVYKTQLVVYIIKDNGEIDDVSVLNTCIIGKNKNNLLVAMRVAIQPQIDEYRLKNRIDLCEKCGSTDRIEIDHHNEKKTFQMLYCDFMSINDLNIPNTFDNTEGHLKCFKKTDKLFEEKWIAYHRDNAILRMLCRKCNEYRPFKKKIEVGNNIED